MFVARGHGLIEVSTPSHRADKAAMSSGLISSPHSDLQFAFYVGAERLFVIDVGPDFLQVLVPDLLAVFVLHQNQRLGYKLVVSDEMLVLWQIHVHDLPFQQAGLEWLGEVRDHNIMRQALNLPAGHAANRPMEVVGNDLGLMRLARCLGCRGWHVCRSAAGFPAVLRKYCQSQQNGNDCYNCNYDSWFHQFGPRFIFKHDFPILGSH